MDSEELIREKLLKFAVDAYPCACSVNVRKSANGNYIIQANTEQSGGWENDFVEMNTIKKRFALQLCKLIKLQKPKRKL